MEPTSSSTCPECGTPLVSGGLICPHCGQECRHDWVPHVEGSNAKREEKRIRLPYRWIRIFEHEVRNNSFKERILEVFA